MASKPFVRLRGQGQLIAYRLCYADIGSHSIARQKQSFLNHYRRNLIYPTMTSASKSLSGFSRTSSFVVGIVVLLTVALPRLLVAGGLPTTDEGVYAYYAQVIHASLASGHGLPDAGPLALYPLLVNWVFAFDVNPLIALRLVDILAAVAAGYALFRVIEVECRSQIGTFLITSIVLFTMNQPMFIQYGFKNSIHAAYIPLFAALWLGLTAPATATKRRWLGIGALLAIAVLLREPFLSLAAFGALAVLAGRGVRPFGWLTLGAFALGGTIVAAVLFARGGIGAAIAGYREAAPLYASVADKRTEFFFIQGSSALKESAVVVILAGAGLAAVLIRNALGDRITSASRLGFWIVATLIPLIEPISKIGFPYHFAVCLPGLAGLAALGWRNAKEGINGIWKWVAPAAFIVSLLLLLIPRVGPLTAAWPQTREALAAFRSGTWPESFIDKSNYLLAAKAIREAAPPNGTVAISGFMYALYPLTGLAPPEPDFANLSGTLIQKGYSWQALRDALRRDPPDVIFVTYRTDWPGASELLEAVKATGLYEVASEVPVDKERSYGTFGGLVFRAVR